MLRLVNRSPARTPLSWYGGKTSKLGWLSRYLPPAPKFVDVFGGSAAVILSRQPALVEIYNDLDADLVNLFRVLKDEQTASRLREKLLLTPYSRLEYDNCRRQHPSSDPVERARQYFVLVRQSFSSIADGSWGYSIMTPLKSFHSALKLFRAASERLRDIRIENQPFHSLIAAEQGPETLFYLDPPYLDETRKTTREYRHEMTRADHVELLDQICAAKGMIVLSGYPSPLYDDCLKGWHTVDKQFRCLAATIALPAGRLTKPIRTERLWINDAAWKQLIRFGRVTDMNLPEVA